MELKDKETDGLGTPDFHIGSTRDLLDYNARFRNIVSAALLTDDKELLNFIKEEAVGRLGSLNNVMVEISDIAKTLGKKF